jgi:protocatechuate 3,4-dioxygenase beta subunit
MRRVLTVAALLVVVAALVMRLLATAKQEGSAASAAPPAPALEAAAERPEEMRAPEPAAEAPRQEVEATAPAADTPPAAERATCTVLGRVVDEYGAPLEGVEVRLQAHEIWAEGIDVARLPGKSDLRGWVATSDSDGRFRFDAPVPSAATTWITIEPDDFHDSERIDFGGRRGDAKPALAAGETDLGTLTLATTGAIRGRVLDEAGQPIEDAQLRVGTERSTTIQRDATTDVRGDFTIGHVPAGVFGVNAKHESHLSEFRTPLTIECNRYTEAGDFLLKDAPVLCGVVVDPAGLPVAGAKLWGWPTTSGAGAGGKSAADGTFTIYLPQDEPYTLGATCEGYDAVSDHDRSRTYAPGSTDVRIVMEHSQALAVLVVDKESDEPLEQFGYDVLLDNSAFGSQHVFTERRRPRVREFPGGRADIPFRAGEDLVLVAAPGHSTATIDLDPAKPAERPYVLRLERSATVSGVCIESGSAVAKATVRLEPGHEMSLREDEPLQFSVDRNKVVTISTGADGSFTFEDVDPGRYRVVAQAPSGTACTLAPFDVRQGVPVDLGRVELEAAATITGRVVLPPGRALAGRTVRLDDPFTGPSAVTDTEGRFRLESVPAGAHAVRLEEVPGEFGGTERLHLELAAGEVREVVLDASALGTCDVRLAIFFGGKARKSLQVSLRTGEGYSGEERQLGATGEDGRVGGSVPVASDYRVEVWSPATGRLEHPSARIAAPLDGHVDEVVDFQLGSLDLVWPASAPAAERTSVSISLLDAASERSWSASLSETPGAFEQPGLDAAARRVQLEYVPVGDWDLTFELYEADAKPEMVPASENSWTSISWTSKRRALFTDTARVRITAGQTADVRLP